MRNLILSNRFAMNKKRFWLTVFAMAAASFIITCASYIKITEDIEMWQSQWQEFELTEYIDHLGFTEAYCWDRYFLYPLYCLPFVLFVFNAFFICRESENKTIRNKLTVGYKKREIYLANFVTAAETGIALYIAVILGSLVGIILAGKNAFTGMNIPLHLLIGLTEVISCAALSSFICMQFQKRATALFVSIAVCCILCFVASYIGNRVQQPEFSYGLEGSSEGVITLVRKMNPDYIKEPLRTVCYTLLGFLPFGNIPLLSKYEYSLNYGFVERPLLSALLPLLFTATITSAGIFLFNRKDLK